MPVGGVAEPVLLGEIEPLGYRFGTDLGAAQAVAEVNAAGGVLGGRPPRIELSDDRADPTVAVAQLRELVAHDSTSLFSRTGLATQEAMAAGYGVEFATRQVFSTGTTDFDHLLAEVAASGAHALMVWATGPPTVAITGPFAHAGQGIPPVMSHGAATQDYLTGAGAATEAVLVATSLAVAGPELPDSPVRDAVPRMAGPFTEAHGRYPSRFAFDGYGAVRPIAAAIDHAGLTVDDVAVTVVRGGAFALTDWFRTQLEHTLAASS
jgi:branched-chain amino acid transport system substrate-binding protein